MTQKSLLAALTLSSLPGLAQDFAKGLAAFETGDYSTALEEWRPLAQQGNAKA